MRKFSAVLLAVLMTFSSFTVSFANAAEKTEETQLSQTNEAETTVNPQQQVNQNVSENTDFSEMGTGNNPLTEEQLAEMTSVSTVAQYKKAVGLPNLKNAANLPANVDNSQSKYFPPIGNQGSVSSCCSWADIYYMMSYTENRVNDRTATYDNSLSPLWVYNAVNKGKDAGTNTAEVLNYAKNFGVASLHSYPNVTDYKPFGSTHDSWKEAQQYKVSNIINYKLPSEDTFVTSPDDADIQTIKTALGNGDILTFATFANGFYESTIQKNDLAPENAKYDGQTIVPYMLNQAGSHRMTIVGYNDNLWYDINNDGKVQEGEKGAFKVANSWSTKYHNDGFTWISYDAMNKVSSVDCSALSTVRGNYQTINEVVGLTVQPAENVSNINLEYTITAKYRSTVRVDLSVTDSTGKTEEVSMYPRNTMLVNYSFDGTLNDSSATLSLDLSKAVSNINSENLSDYKFKVTFNDAVDDDGTLKVNDVKIVDYNYDTEYKADIQTEQSINYDSKVYGINTTKSLIQGGSTTQKYVEIKNHTVNSVDGVIYNSEVLKMTANGIYGKAPYQYSFGYNENGSSVFMSSFSSSNSIDIALYGEKTINPVISIKDADGNIVTKTYTEVAVKNKMKIDRVYLDTVANTTKSLNAVPVGRTCYVSFKLNDAVCDSTSYGDRYTRLQLTVRHNGKVVEYEISQYNNFTFYADACGKYSLEIEAIDLENHRDTCTYGFYVVNSSKTATIYSPDKYNLEYYVYGSIRTSQMTADSRYNGYNYKATVDLSQIYQTKAHFSDPNGKIYNNNGTDFDLSFGAYLYKDGQLISISDTGNNLSMAEDVTFERVESQYINYGLSTAFASIVGGVAPYTYSLKIESNENKIENFITKTTYDTSSSMEFYLHKNGNYRITAKITDALGNTVESTSANSVTINNSLTIAFLTPSVNSPQKLGKSISFSSVVASSPYKYNRLTYDFYMNGVLTESIETKDGSSVTWTPTEAGKYTVMLTLYNYHGDFTRKSMDYEIIGGSLKIDDSQTHISSDSVDIGQYYTVNVAANGGVSPYKYQFGYIHNGEKTVFDYSNDNWCNLSHFDGGDYQIFVTVKDSTGSLITKTIGTVNVKSLAVTAVNTSLQSPQPVEAPITLNAEFKNASSKYGNYGECKFTIMKNGVVTDVFNSTGAITPDWTPREAGDYTITYSMRDMYDQTDSMTIPYTVTSKSDVPTDTNKITVYYNGYTNPNIHYMISQNNWTSVPGVAMTKTDEQPGYTHKYTVDIGKNTSFTCCFNDGNNNWDSKNGANYYIDNIIGNTVYGIKNGNKQFISQTVASDLKIVSVVNSSTSVNAGEFFNITATVSGGTAPYKYQFGYIKDGTRYYLDNNFTGSSMNSTVITVEGNYKTFVDVLDSKGNFATKTTDLTIIDNSLPIQISSFKSDKISVEIGEIVKLTATAVNGIPLYKIKYAYILNGVKNYITESAYSDSSFEWKPEKEGLYTLVAEAYDVNNKKAEAVIRNFVVISSTDSTGDVNRNGIFDVNDITDLQRYIAGITQLSDSGLVKADINGDGRIDVSDVTTLQIILARK